MSDNYGDSAAADDDDDDKVGKDVKQDSRGKNNHDKEDHGKDNYNENYNHNKIISYLQVCFQYILNPIKFPYFFFSCSCSCHRKLDSLQNNYGRIKDLSHLQSWVDFVLLLFYWKHKATYVLYW